MPISSLVNRGDPAEVLAEIDHLCADDAWEELLQLANSCRVASIERGKPLWGCAAHAEYRVALDAPPEFAALVMDVDLGPMALGGIPEVIASTHDFDEMLSWIPTRATPLWESFIFECVVRGDDVVSLGLDADLADRMVSDHQMPLLLADWEPEVASPRFKKDKVEVDRPVLMVEFSRQIEPDSTDALQIDDPESLNAVHGLVPAWQAESNGLISVAANESLDAAVRLVDPNAQMVQRLDAQSAIALMMWSAADGGAHGRRRGLARGRSAMRAALTAIGGINSLASEDQFAELVEELRFFTWDNQRTGEGWSLALAIEDPIDHAAFAICATDHRSKDLLEGV